MITEKLTALFISYIYIENIQIYLENYTINNLKSFSWKLFLSKYFRSKKHHEK